MLGYERMHFFEEQFEAGLAFQSHVAVSGQFFKLGTGDRSGQKLTFLYRRDLIALYMENESRYVELACHLKKSILLFMPVIRSAFSLEQLIRCNSSKLSRTSLKRRAQSLMQ